MNRPAFAIAAALCFAAGWGADSWIAAGGDVPRGGEKGNRGSLPGEERFQAGSGHAEARQSKEQRPAADEIHSAADLRKLVIPGREAATRARIERALARLNPDDFAAIAGGLKKSDDHVAIATFAEWWMRVDPVPALEFVLTVQSHLTGDLDYAFWKAMAKVFSSDLPAATRLMAVVEGRETYIYARHWCIEAIKGKDPAEALAMIVEFDGRTRNELFGAQSLGDFPRQWIERDPQTAMTWALELPPGFTRREILGSMSRAWGTLDAAAAQAWLDSIPTTALPQGNLRSNLASNISRAKAAAAPPK